MTQPLYEVIRQDGTHAGDYTGDEIVRTLLLMPGDRIVLGDGGTLTVRMTL